MLFRTKIRLRLMIAIPSITTLLVLGLGLITIDMANRELLINKDLPSTQIEYSKRIEGTIDDITILVVIGGVLALVSGLSLAVAITAPIRKLTDDTVSIARGDLSRTIRLGGDGEIAQLGSAFNEMVASINKYLIQSISGGVVTINDRGYITAMSADSEVILGVESAELVNRHITELIPDTKENKLFHTVINDALENKKTYAGREMTVTTESRDAIPISISTSFLQDRDNTLIGLIISFEDVKHLRKIQEQMQKLDRLSTLGGLAAGIAHQVRNPLCSIKGLAQLLKENADANPQLIDYSDVILSDVDRIDRVIDRLLRFIQPSASGWTYESVNDIIDDTLLLGKHEIRKKDIEIRVEKADGIPQTLCQRENLVQALLNVVVNAFQAIENRGRVTIRTTYETGGEASAVGTVKISISNDGPPISPGLMKKIFDPNFTTKEDGAGFGLAITEQTVEFHGGRIDVSSMPGEDTVFEISLPISKKDIRDNETRENAESI